MKKLINKIKAWFSRKTKTDTNAIFERCDDLAKRYGTRCSSLSFNYTYYLHNQSVDCTVYVQTLARSCEKIDLEMDNIDVDKILATFELMLIKDYGKAKEM